MTEYVALCCRRQKSAVKLKVDCKGRGLVAAATASDGHRIFSEYPLHVVALDEGDRVSGAMDFALAAFKAKNAHMLKIVSDMCSWKEMEPMFEDWMVEDVKERYVKERTKALNKLVGMYCCNALTLISRKDSSTTGILPMVECMNHSCSPNCVYDYNAAESLVLVTATQCVAKGEELCISYLKRSELAKSVAGRRALLKDRFNFWCGCKRCVAEESAAKTKAKGKDKVKCRGTVKPEAKSKAKARLKTKSKPKAKAKATTSKKGGSSLPSGRRKRKRGV